MLLINLLGSHVHLLLLVERHQSLKRELEISSAHFEIVLDTRMPAFGSASCFVAAVKYFAHPVACNVLAPNEPRSPDILYWGARKLKQLIQSSFVRLFCLRIHHRNLSGVEFLPALCVSEALLCLCKRVHVNMSPAENVILER